MFHSESFLLGLLFADYTFVCVNGEEVLVSAEQLLLLIDLALDDVPVFCHPVHTLQGLAISANEHLQCYAINAYLIVT
jgi:hypothetical protein